MNEQKNLLLAIVASLIILLIFQYLFPTEKKPAQETTKIEKTETIKDKFKVLPRVKVIENDQRIYLSNSSRIRGSISLKGARFDDIILKDYKEAINPEAKEVTLLSPKNTKNPYFIELGWMSQQNVNLPNKDTIWELVAGKN